jgi:molybdopterin synthase catalytic subunit
MPLRAAPAERVSLTTELIDLPALAGLVRSAACGAVVTFAGTVRERCAEGRLVRALSYEIYPAMALAEMRRIAAEITAKFAPVEIAMTHRGGELAVGETSVAIAVAAPHRAAAFAACEYAIDELKARVPVWKKEHYADGSSAWRENCASR